MRKLGFDPSALLFKNESQTVLCEAVLRRLDDGHLQLALSDEGGSEFAIVELRPAFLDEFVAQARASEQSAA